jgi:hypothetical protein
VNLVLEEYEKIKEKRLSSSPTGEELKLDDKNKESALVNGENSSSERVTQRTKEESRKRLKHMIHMVGKVSMAFGGTKNR